MKIFFISPVRLATEESTDACRQYVENLEKSGHSVHWPLRDTDQTDPIGIKICDTNLRNIVEADEVHIWYLKESTGIHFDMGCLYMLVRILGYKKRVVFVNQSEFTDELDFNDNRGKSFAKVLKFLDQDTAQQE